MSFTIILFTGISLLFTSCKDESLKLIPDTLVSTIQNEEELLNNFAKTLAITMKNESELRQILKAEVLKKFDGTYSVLYNAIKSRQLSNGKSVENTILQYAENKNSLILLSESMLNLNIKVPTFKNADVSMWDDKSFSPSVAVNPFRKETMINSYNSNGILSQKSASIEPLEVIILGERNQYVNIKSIATLAEDVKKSLENIYIADSFNEHNTGGKSVESNDKQVEGFSSGIHNPYSLTDTQKESTRLYLGDIRIPANS